MKTNYRRSSFNKAKDAQTDEFDRREAKVKVFKAARKEKHSTKNQRPHQLVRYFQGEEEDI